MRTDVKGKEDLGETYATVAANGDAEIGKIIAEGGWTRSAGRRHYRRETRRRSRPITSCVEGMQFDRAYLSPYSSTLRDDGVRTRRRARPHLRKEISVARDMLPILRKVVQAGKPLLIIARRSGTADALATLVVNVIKDAGQFKVWRMKAPGYGDRPQGHAARPRRAHRPAKSFSTSLPIAPSCGFDFRRGRKIASPPGEHGEVLQHWPCGGRRNPMPSTRTP